MISGRLPLRALIRGTGGTRVRVAGGRVPPGAAWSPRSGSPTLSGDASTGRHGATAGRLDADRRNGSGEALGIVGADGVEVADLARLGTGVESGRDPEERRTGGGAQLARRRRHPTRSRPIRGADSGTPTRTTERRLAWSVARPRASARAGRSGASSTRRRTRRTPRLRAWLGASGGAVSGVADDRSLESLPAIRPVARSRLQYAFLPVRTRLSPGRVTLLASSRCRAHRSRTTLSRRSVVSCDPPQITVRNVSAPERY